MEGRGQASKEGTRMGASVAQSKCLAPELTSSSLLLSHHPSFQVTLSYGVFENKLNVIELSGPFSPQEDPSRYGAGVLWVVLRCEPSDNRLGRGGRQMECRRLRVRDMFYWEKGHTSIKLFVNASKLCKPFWMSGKKRSIKTFYLDNS